MVLGDQLDTYIIDLCGDDEFSSIEGIASLAEKMIKNKEEFNIFISIYAYQIIITSTSCNCYSRKSFFCYVYCQE